MEYNVENNYREDCIKYYGGVKELIALKEEAVKDKDYIEFCNTITDNKKVELEDICYADYCNDIMAGSTVANYRDRIAIRYKGYYFYLSFFAEEDSNRSYNILYGRNEYTLGNFELVQAKEILPEKETSTCINPEAIEETEDSPF